jgi:hypothetical protein
MFQGSRAAMLPCSPPLCAWPLLAAVLMLCGFGCAGSAPTQQLTFDSAAQKQSFSEQFAGAYLTRDREGDAEVVLIDPATEQAIAGVHSDAPVRQVMHLHLLWNPIRDMKGDHRSAFNATIHWYVMGNTPEAAADIIEYAGNAYITSEHADGATELTIRNASMRPIACRGDLKDPVGPCGLHGSIRAVENQRRVRQVLASVRTAVSEADSHPGSLSYTAKSELPSSVAR